MNIGDDRYVDLSDLEAEADKLSVSDIIDNAREALRPIESEQNSLPDTFRQLLDTYSDASTLADDSFSLSIDDEEEVLEELNALGPSVPDSVPLDTPAESQVSFQEPVESVSQTVLEDYLTRLVQNPEVKRVYLAEEKQNFQILRFDSEPMPDLRDAPVGLKYLVMDIDQFRSALGVPRSNDDNFRQEGIVNLSNIPNAAITFIKNANAIRIFFRNRMNDPAKAVTQLTQILRLDDDNSNLDPDAVDLKTRMLNLKDLIDRHRVDV